MSAQRRPERGRPRQGHYVLGRMSLCGHHVPDDVLNGDLHIEDMSIEDMVSLDGCPCGDTMSLSRTSPPRTSSTGMSSART